MDVLVLSAIAVMFTIPMMSLTLGLSYQLLLLLSTVWEASQGSLLFRRVGLRVAWMIQTGKWVGSIVNHLSDLGNAAHFGGVNLNEATTLLRTVLVQTIPVRRSFSRILLPKT